MRENYWVNVYKLRKDLINLLYSYGVSFNESKPCRAKPHIDRITPNGAIALICEDTDHPLLPTSICTPLGKITFVSNTRPMFGKNTSNKTVMDTISAMTILFDIVPVVPKISHGILLHRYAIHRLPWSDPSTLLLGPTFLPDGQFTQRDIEQSDYLFNQFNV